MLGLRQEKGRLNSTLPAAIAMDVPRMNDAAHFT